MNPLYIVPTPLGNLEDITIRSLNTLKISDLILCEDTRRTSILLNHYSIKKKLVSFNKDNEDKKIDKVLELLKTNIISLVSDAGTPTVSDPGSKLVKKLIEEEIQVIPLPGPSSITTAFSASGLDGNFTFAGFLPKNENDLKKNIRFIRNTLKISKKFTKSKILYGGSVNPVSYTHLTLPTKRIV